MRYLMALMLIWGVCHFTSAQNDNQDCPGSASNKDVEMKMQPAEETSSSAECPKEQEMTSSTATSSNTTVVEEKKEHSTFGKIWRAPLKMVANIPKAVFSIGSETVEGAAHIVGAPFKGLGKLFGRDEVDNKDKYVEETTTKNDVVVKDEYESDNNIILEDGYDNVIIEEEK